MALRKTIAAKVSAYFTSWVDPDDFATSAENNLIYRQRSHVGSKPEFGFYVISGKEKSYPLDLLTNREALPNLGLVLPYDAVTLATIPILWFIEITRKAGDFETVFGIDIVGDVGKDQSTGEVRYACISFDSVVNLLGKIQERAKKHRGGLRQIRGKSVWLSNAGIQRPLNAYIGGMLKGMLRNMKKHSVTLVQVEEFAQSARRYKVPD